MMVNHWEKKWLLLHDGESLREKEHEDFSFQDNFFQFASILLTKSVLKFI